MNFFSKGSIAGLVLASGVVFAAEPAEGWYAGFFAGPSYAPSVNFNINNPFSTNPLWGKLTYDVLANGGGQVGYRCYKFRYEGELVFNTNNFDSLSINNFTIGNNQGARGLSIKGSTSLLAGLFNAYYEFYDEDYSETKFVPYVGLGIGYAYVRNKLDFYYNSPQFNRVFLLNSNNNSESSSAAIGQGILGLSYFFNDNVSLGTDLRYMSTRKITRFDSRVEAVTWNFLMNFSFDQP
jgi:opacity protein-like surface antigen